MSRNCIPEFMTSWMTILGTFMFGMLVLMIIGSVCLGAESFASHCGSKESAIAMTVCGVVLFVCLGLICCGSIVHYIDVDNRNYRNEINQRV